MVKNLPTNAGDLGLIPGRGHATHSSILAWRIPMDREAWWGTVHRVAKSQISLKRLSSHAYTHTRKHVKHVLQKRVIMCTCLSGKVGPAASPSPGPYKRADGQQVLHDDPML